MATYEIRAIQVIASAPTVLVRELTFGPGEATPWHRHTHADDHCYGLDGEVRLERKDAPPVTLGPGAARHTPAGLLHRIVNAGPAPARVLLVQSGGAYDFLEA
jgi:quercetin dioxygenase-like cupin family protein